MASSYEKINYSLRPSKHIERKMLIETFRNLSDFSAVENYRYVGFGSIYFSDFYLVHKSLGIKEMVSLEKDSFNSERFEFNCPFNCIDLRFGNSLELLPQLTWSQRTILWLDYDGTLNSDVLADISCFFANATMGSVFVITVNAHPERLPNDGTMDEKFEKILENLKQRVGEKKVPADVSGKDLRKWNVAKVYRRIINNHIHETLTARNGGRASGNKILYQQLYNFHYADGMNMLTVGGIIYDEGQEHILRKAMFDERFSYVKTGDDPYVISVPNLTYRELRHLNMQLPIDDPSKLISPKIKLEDLKTYSEIYRYFPTFADTDL